jgi:hypothetical protein
MKFRSRTTIVPWMATLLLTIVPSPAYTQTDASGYYNVYDDIIEKAFPWPTLNADTPLTITLRFLPSFSPPSQIIMKVNQNSCTVEHLKAGVSIGRLIATRSLPAILDRDAVTNALQIERKNHRIDDHQTKEWLDAFWDALSRTPKAVRPNIGKFQLDGTEYELEILSGLTHWRLSIADTEAGKTVNGDTPIVRWMNSVRLAVDKLH